MKNHKIIKITACILLTVTIILVPFASFAAGDGTGGGKGAVVPLYMDWSYPADGASGVSVTPVIQCKFSHNVAQYNVRDRNKTLVELTEDGGGKVDINVFMADAQLYFDKRQFIYVSPVKPLKYGTGYTLTLKEGIQAKNNMATDEDQSIHFVTGYGRSDFNAPLVTPPVSTELDNTQSTAGDAAVTSGSGTNGENNAAGANGTAGAKNVNAAKSFFDKAFGSIGGLITGIGKTDNKTGSGKKNSKADSAGKSAETDGAAKNDEADGIGKDAGTDSTGKDAETDGTGKGGDDNFESSEEAGNTVSFIKENLLAIIIAGLLILAIAVGIMRAAAMRKRYSAAELARRHSGGAKQSDFNEDANTGMQVRASGSGAKHIISIFLACMLAAGSAGLYGAHISYASVPKSFKIRLLVGETVVSEKSYTDDELRQLTQTRQCFSGIDEEGLPCTVSAEGILLTDYVVSQGITEGEISKVTVYAPDNWQRSFIYNYLYGVKRYRYPHLSKAWQIENGEADGESSEGDAGNGTAGDAENGNAGNSGVNGTAGGGTGNGSSGNGTSGDTGNNGENGTSGNAGNSGGNSNAGSGTSGGAGADASGTVSLQSISAAAADVDTAALRKSDASQVYPMLALRSYTAEVSDADRYDALGASEGYRFCFGQLNPSDGAYLMYGYNLTGMDIIVSATGDYARSVGLEDKTGLKTATPGGADSAGSVNVQGPYEDKITGQTASSLPDSLTIQVGYFGTEYYTIKKFTFEELANMPLIRQAYSGRSSSGKTGTLTALGVRLVDIVTAAGVDISSVEKFGFYREDASVQDITSAGVTASSSWLIDMNRYYYPNMTNVIDYTTGKSGAALNAVRTDTLIALKSYWDESSVPDFFKLDATTRFRLVFGQTSTKSDNLSKSMPWISTIRIQLYGSPSSENWLDDYLGKTVGSGTGSGSGSTGSGSGGSGSGTGGSGTGTSGSGTGVGSLGTGSGGSGSGAGSSDSAASDSVLEVGDSDSSTAAADDIQNSAGSGDVKNLPTSDSDDSKSELVNTAGKHVYEISAGSGAVSFNPDKSINGDKNDHRVLIALSTSLMLVMGACTGIISYRRKIFRRKIYKSKKG